MNNSFNLENIAKESKTRTVTNNEEYNSTRNTLFQLEAESKRILEHFDRARKSTDKNNLFYLDDTMSSKYLKMLATTLEKFEDLTQDYHLTAAWTSQEEPPDHVYYGDEYARIVNLKDDPFMFTELSRQLFMYSAYLKQKNDPSVLDSAELKRVKPHSFKKYSFALEMSEEAKQLIEEKTAYRRDKINSFINNTMKKIGYALGYIDTKIFGFLDKYKYNESGTLEEYLLQKQNKKQ